MTITQEAMTIAQKHELLIKSADALRRLASAGLTEIRFEISDAPTDGFAFCFELSCQVENLCVVAVATGHETARFVNGSALSLPDPEVPTHA